MSTLTVDIITPEHSFAEALSANSILIPALQGEVEVLPGHTTYLTSLGMGRLLVNGAKGPQAFAVNGGFAEVSQDHVRILADEIVSIARLNAGEVKKQQTELQEKISQSDPFSPEADALQAQRRYLDVQAELVS